MRIPIISLLVGILTACTPPAQPTMTLQGTLTLEGGPAPTAAFAPGQVVVKFKPNASLQSSAGVGVFRLSPLSTTGTSAQVFALEGAAGGSTNVLEAVAALSRLSEVEYVQPNYIVRTQTTPDDPMFPEQWNMMAARFPQAWGLENGSSNPVTVAVIDSGILWRNSDPTRSHPDLPNLARRMLPGYDFISEPSVAGDGDGRDPDPYDDGNVGGPNERSGYHGTHVAGILGAASDNGLGVAGVSWGVRILPLRVIGVGGGNIADLADAILWAVGATVPGMPANLNPARVINLSLGAAGQCADNPLLEEAILEAQRRGTLVAAAASNANTDVRNFFPANCPGVVSVGAATREGNRASYSNYGSELTLMAPGGAVGDGVLSLGRDDLEGRFTYVRQAGTSMAAPHVAGAAALLLSYRPGLTNAQVVQALSQSAIPLTAGGCSRSEAGECGAGLLDAGGALRLVEAGLPPLQPGFTLQAQDGRLELFAGGRVSTRLVILPTNGFAATPVFRVDGLPTGVQAVFGIYNSTQRSVELELVGEGTLTAGNQRLTVTATAGSVATSVELELVVLTAIRPPTLRGVKVVACYWDGSGCDKLRSRVLTLSNDAVQSPFSVEGLEAGGYYLLAWKDTDADNSVNGGDFLGTIGDPNTPRLIRGSEGNLPLLVYPWHETAWVSVEARRALLGMQRLLSADP